MINGGSEFGFNYVNCFYITDNFEHRASVRASLAKDSDWIGQYFGKVVSMFQWQENLTLNALPGRPQDVLHPDGKGNFKIENGGKNLNKEIHPFTVS